MNQNRKIYSMVLSALLIAIGIIIPMASPIKVIIEPASFTLASHVAIMIAMFVSPFVAVSVALGTTLGFFLGGFPVTVVLRALSHIIWAFAGAAYLKKYPETFTSKTKSILFILAIGLLHAAGEVAIVTPLYSGSLVSQDYLYTVFTLVGIGTVIHSSVDFIISLAVWSVLSDIKSVTRFANVKDISLLKTKTA